jgi:hypothetical protein
MAKAIRQLGLKIVVALLRILERPPTAGWKRSRRPPTLNGR